MILSKLIKHLEGYVGDVTATDVLQWLGVASSATAAVLYFARWYHLSFVVLHEYAFIDFNITANRTKHALTDEQVFASSQRDVEVTLLKNVLQSPHKQLLALWGADLLSIESIVFKALHDTQAKTILLDFRTSVWAENVDAWMDRMEQASNATHVFVKQFANLLTSLGLSNHSITHQTTENDHDGEDSARLLRFRMLLSEKLYLMQSYVAKEPNRSLVFVVLGLDRLMKLEQSHAEHQRGNKFLHEYLEYLVQMSIHVPGIKLLPCLSDTFWVTYWLRNEAARRSSWSIHITSLPSDTMVTSLQHSFDLPHKPWITKKDLVQVSKCWGNDVSEVLKVVRFLSVDANISVTQLLTDEIQQFVLKWFMNRDASTGLGNSGEDEDNVSVVSSHLDDFDADLSNVSFNFNFCDEMKIIQKIASSSIGKIPFKCIILYKKGKYLQTVMSMIKRNVLKLEMCYEDDNKDIATLQTSEFIKIFEKELVIPSDDEEEEVSAIRLEPVIEESLKKINFMISLKRPVEHLAAQYICKLIGK